MKFGLTTGQSVKRAESNLASYQKVLKQHENKKVFETMMSLAQFGELTPEKICLLYVRNIKSRKKEKNKG